MKKINTYLLSMVILSGCNNGGVTPASSLTNETGNQSGFKYESPEHYLLASAIKLQYPTGSIAADRQIVLPIKLNNQETINLTFAQIVYLAGDYMGDPNLSIGNHDLKTNQLNFITNFNVLSSSPAKEYLPKIIALVNNQINANKDNIIAGKELNIPEGSNIDFNCATGGGCYTWDWLLDYGLYMKLAEVNFDHFGKDAINSYLAGHSSALNIAATITPTTPPELKTALLNKAYAYEAFSAHFLTDLFASGHLRTPRRELVNWCSYTSKISKSIPGFLAKVMHDEDNKNGLYLTTNQGNSFKTFGDKELFINDNSGSMNIAISTLQQSTDQIYNVANGKISVSNALANAYQWLPNLDKIITDSRNMPALFKYENNQIYEYNQDTRQYSLLSNCVLSAISHGWQEYSVAMPN